MGIAKELIAAAARGLLRELSVNPRDLRIQCELDGQTHVLAKLDARSLQDLLAQSAHQRKLQLKLGNLVYEIALPSAGKRSRTVGRAPKQRGR